MTQQVNDIYEALLALYSEEKRLILPRFFKTGKGEYGEGDRFIGVVAPDTRTFVQPSSRTLPSRPSRNCWRVRGTRCASAVF